ncbi:flippase [Pseudoalteromonas sp. MB47]|uniref:flippase n=1 Tax=Pseudoalteromonas sp. MB47 TaxID=2588452 RepID=UPI0014074E4A|nr:flippase [Pseudoalteromonas sp. MB47]NHH89278.1 putative O-antigen transporter [Pseudoalteromonas sp. MB47]
MPIDLGRLIKRLTKSKDGKVLASNFGYLLLFQIASYAFPLITLPYLAKVLGVNGFGKIAFAAAVILWFRTITDWGFNYTATRDLARNRDNPIRSAQIFSNVLWSKVFLSILSFIFLLLLIYTVPYFYENKEILIFTFSLIPGHILFPEWYFQALERMKYITIINLISKALFTILIFIVIKDKSDFLLQPLLVSTGYAVSGLFALYIIVVKWKVKIYKPEPRVIFKMIKESTNVFIINFLPNIYYGFSTVLLGFLSGPAAVGVLDAGRKLLSISEQFMQVVSRVFFPFLARKADKHKVYVRIHLTLSLFFCSILFLFAPILIELLLTEEFHSAVNIVRISAFSIIFLSFRNIYGTNYLILHGFERESRNIILFTSIFGFLIAFPLIHYYGYLGAALTATLTHALQGGCMYRKAKKVEIWIERKNARC